MGKIRTNKNDRKMTFYIKLKSKKLTNGTETRDEKATAVDAMGVLLNQQDFVI